MKVPEDVLAGTYGVQLSPYVTFSEGLFRWRDVQAIGKQIRLSS